MVSGNCGDRDSEGGGREALTPARRWRRWGEGLHQQRIQDMQLLVTTLSQRLELLMCLYKHALLLRQSWALSNVPWRAVSSWGDSLESWIIHLKLEPEWNGRSRGWR
ncbi:hypothetical protein Salat_0528500 [Sesamum alatum]|uniref:Uncharacterized protein n=1 Tax=Sesamum alatum TaxID=300844 RepID=A0AAE1YPS3_9LAMI|nr:hypothetical protein Salat_0528500 [Sesamum alatum]